MNTKIGPRTLLFPIFRWRVLQEPKNEEIVERLRSEFLRAFRDEMGHSVVYAASANGGEFLCPLKSILLGEEVAIVLDDPLESHPQLTPGRKIVLFDLSLNTGETLWGALGRLRKLELRPNLVLLLIFNDLVPPSIRGEPWVEANAELRFLYTASSLIRRWEGYGPIVDELTVIRDALAGQGDLRSPRVARAFSEIAALLGEHTLEGTAH